MNTKTRIRKLEAQAQETASNRTSKECFPQNCICFPGDEPPDFEVFDTNEERGAAVALLCPLHGKRFTEPLPFQVYKAKWLRDREWKDDFPTHSRQYARAMRASFPDGQTRGQDLAELRTHVLERMWELANIPASQTNNTIEGQCQALKLLAKTREGKAFLAARASEELEELKRRGVWPTEHKIAVQ
jgi:hypothetical protein